MEQTIFRWYQLRMELEPHNAGTLEVMAMPGGLLIRNIITVSHQRATEFGTEIDDIPHPTLVWVPGLTLRLDSNQKPILIGKGD